ncbi:kinesin motor catalytic domain protein (macronuclear) [Tetrahymena thermophila SB210]|uniref:Kinesin motor catalytic domain protein n=1 Tax=Tetrahymena thermophila (strain SB210) TaxID=312017 RepID=Q22RJ6_TETTS|nr:kinesin motor catalytic domain protein [Tetrahymena thermophila SB210]EAR88126.2 kinesin motor catalytic domain protein [Tetrahymena thermophila SB210]|eukprot:XP_001008371.2 kinesin motor catalytic domain protein [Tetrahymena thermophila SB210]
MNLNLNFLGNDMADNQIPTIPIQQQQQNQQHSNHMFNQLSHPSNQNFHEQYQNYSPGNHQSFNIIDSEDPMPMDQFLSQQHNSSSSQISQSESSEHELSTDSLIQSLQEGLMLASKSAVDYSMNYSNSLGGRTHSLTQKNNCLTTKTFNKQLQSHQVTNEDEITYLNKRSQYVLDQLAEIAEEQENTFQNLQERNLQYLKQIAFEKIELYKVEFSKVLQECEQYRQESQDIKEKFDEHLLSCEGAQPNREEEFNVLMSNLQKKEEEIEFVKKHIEVKYSLDFIIENVEKEFIRKQFSEEIQRLEEINLELENKCEIFLEEKKLSENKFNQELTVLKLKIEDLEKINQKKSEENVQILSEFDNCKQELIKAESEIERIKQTSLELNSKISSLESTNSLLNAQIEKIAKQLKEKESIITQFDKDRLDQTNLLQKLQEELALKNDTLERFQVKSDDLNQNNKNQSQYLNGEHNQHKTDTIKYEEEVNKLKLELEDKNNQIKKLKQTILIKDRMQKQTLNGSLTGSGIKKSQTPTLLNHQTSVNDQSLLSTINNNHNQSFQHQDTQKISSKEIQEQCLNSVQKNQTDKELCSDEMSKRKALKKIVGDESIQDQSKHQYLMQEQNKTGQEQFENEKITTQVSQRGNNHEVTQISNIDGNTQDVNDISDMIICNTNHQRLQKKKHKSIDSTQRESLGKKLLINHSFKNGFLTQKQSIINDGQCNQSLNINDTIVNNGSMMLSMQQSNIMQQEEVNQSQQQMDTQITSKARRAQSMNSESFSQMFNQDENTFKELKVNLRKKREKQEELKLILENFKKEFKQTNQRDPVGKDWQPYSSVLTEYKNLKNEILEIRQKLIDIKDKKDSNMSISHLADYSMIKNTDDSRCADNSMINNLSIIRATAPHQKLIQYKQKQILNQSHMSQNSFYIDQNQTSLNSISVQLGDYQGFVSTAASHSSKQAEGEFNKGLRLQVSNLEEANKLLKDQVFKSLEYEKELRNKGETIEQLQNEIKDITKKKDEEIKELKDTVDILTNKLDEETKERKILHNIVEDMKGKIRVFCRVRPPNENEVQMNSQNVVEVLDAMNCKLQAKNGPKKFQFDSCFGFSSRQDDIFNDAKKLIQSAVDGYNVCIFAYGQTGSGKSFTMQGTREMPGITPRSVNELFNLLKPIQKTCKVTISAYIMELYMDNLIDLLAPPNSIMQKKLEIKEDYITNTTYVQNATIAEVTKKEELEQIIQKGILNRKISKTDMNVESSRSHLIITILINIFNPQTETTTHGKISLIDLAGSERILKSGANPHQVKEANSINKSLTALGDVISALTNQQQNGGERHIPYRNNKLTYLMKDSLGGNAKTLMIVNVSPSEYNLEETNSSLQYASRVKTIVNETSKNIETKDYTRLKEKFQQILQENEKLQELISDQNRNPNQQSSQPNLSVIQQVPQQQIQPNKQTQIYSFGQQKPSLAEDQISSQLNQQQIPIISQQQQKLAPIQPHQQQAQKPSLLASGRNSNNSSQNQQQINQILYNQQQQQQQQQQISSQHKRSNSPLIVNQNQQGQQQNVFSAPHIQLTSQQLYGSMKSSSVTPLQNNININNIQKVNQQQQQLQNQLNRIN